MRSLSRFADKLVNRLAPKAAAAAATCWFLDCGSPGCLRRCCTDRPCGNCYCP